jgi:hypothetical protein
MNTKADEGAKIGSEMNTPRTNIIPKNSPQIILIDIKDNSPKFGNFKKIIKDKNKNSLIKKIKLILGLKDDEKLHTNLLQKIPNNNYILTHYMKLLSDNLTYGYPINKRKSLINDNVHTTKLSIEHPSAFCQFDTCRGKNLIINDAHIMSECKHTPLKEIRHKIRREARKTIVKLMGENDEEKRKLKGSIKKLGNWWGNKSNYEKYKERKRNTKPTEEKTKWTKLPLNFIQTLDYKDIQKRSNNNNSGIYENTLRKQVNKSITEIEMENEMNNTIYNRRELNNENGKKINGKTYRNEDQLQATHNPPKKKKIDINKDKTNVIKIKNNTQIVSTGNIYKYNSNNTHSNTNNNSPPQTNNNTNNNINNTNNDNRKQISKPRIKYYNMYDILNEKNYNEQKINIGMKVNENRNNIKKRKDTPKKKKKKKKNKKIKNK